MFGNCGTGMVKRYMIVYSQNFPSPLLMSRLFYYVPVVFSAVLRIRIPHQIQKSDANSQVKRRIGIQIQFTGAVDKDCSVEIRNRVMEGGRLTEWRRRGSKWSH